MRLGEIAFYALSLAFFASLCQVCGRLMHERCNNFECVQGIAHKFSGEQVIHNALHVFVYDACERVTRSLAHTQATLIALEAHAESAVAFQLSHVTYFPTLLFHTCHQTLTQPKRKAK
jgi:hypothetical protein